MYIGALESVDVSKLRMPEGVMVPKIPLALSTGASLTGAEEGVYVPPEQPVVVQKPQSGLAKLLLAALAGYVAWEILA